LSDLCSSTGHLGTSAGSSSVERGLLGIRQTGLDLRQEIVGGLGR